MTAKEIALRFIDAHNRHDVEAMLDCLDADMKVLDPAQNRFRCIPKTM